MSNTLANSLHFHPEWCTLLVSLRPPLFPERCRCSIWLLLPLIPWKLCPDNLAHFLKLRVFAIQQKHVTPSCCRDKALRDDLYPPVNTSPNGEDTMPKPATESDCLLFCWKCIERFLFLLKKLVTSTKYTNSLNWAYEKDGKKKTQFSDLLLNNRKIWMRIRGFFFNLSKIRN